MLKQTLGKEFEKNMKIESLWLEILTMWRLIKNGENFDIPVH
ncbi:hypothetical protein AM1_D0259 (plasmid) [Acaryochloris marina MBIC11017]|uniref:Uncharacterized protein n=1 Tax=Acaryochloris marina (strain MBIC 11017) TaxID=329726 RepID=A8ZP14_ACAM1|nr:hypothetical protein AM1_D0259 [Acaryochloris marina MBIC11017]